MDIPSFAYWLAETIQDRLNVEVEIYGSDSPLAPRELQFIDPETCKLVQVAVSIEA
jgi:hypothetical protein